MRKLRRDKRNMAYGMFHTANANTKFPVPDSVLKEQNKKNKQTAARVLPKVVPVHRPQPQQSAMDEWEKEYEAFMILMKYCKSHNVPAEYRKLLVERKMTVAQYEAMNAKKEEEPILPPEMSYVPPTEENAPAEPIQYTATEEPVCEDDGKTEGETDEATDIAEEPAAEVVEETPVKKATRKKKTDEE